MPWLNGVLSFVHRYEKENLLTNPQADVSSNVIGKITDEIEHSAGFQTNARARKTIECHAMGCAEAEFRKRGFEVEDVSATKSYDLLCKKADGETKYVEVKGTQGPGHTVVLTAGEVNFVKEHESDCVLCVVNGIRLKGRRNPKALGGHLSVDEPPELSAGVLNPMAFTFYRGK